MEEAYRGRPTDPAAMTRTVRWLIEDRDGTVFVSVHQDAIVGIIGLTIYPHPVSGLSTATELFWFVERDFRGHGLRLLRLATEWARAAGAAELHMIAPTPAVGRLYARLGYTEIETAFSRTL